jgi:hypothetical protein
VVPRLLLLPARRKSSHRIGPLVDFRIPSKTPAIRVF